MAAPSFATPYFSAPVLMYAPFPPVCLKLLFCLAKRRKKGLLCRIAGVTWLLDRFNNAHFLFSLQIMLVFSKEDAQTDSFLHAAERGGYVCKICKTSEEAMEQYINVQPDVRMPFISIVNIKRIRCEINEIIHFELRL